MSNPVIQKFWTSSWKPLVLVGAVLLVYGRSLDAPFLFDDFPSVVRNESIRHVWPPWTMLSPPATAAGATGRPLVNASLALNYALGGLDVRGYHAVNLAWHALTALLLWGVVRRTLRSAMVTMAPAAREPVAFAIAMLWALHPLLTESVICIAQRNEIMGSLFYLLAFYALIRSAQSRGRSKAWWGVGIAAGGLGGLSKEIVVTLPVLLLLHDRTFLAGSFREAWRERKPLYAGMTLPWLVVGALLAYNHNRSGTVGFGLGVSPWEYLLTQCRALVTYLRLALWPAPLVVDYGTAVAHQLREVWAEALAVVTLLALTGWALVRRPVAGFLGAWFFILLAPSSSFVPLTTQTMAEHRMYLALAAVVATVVIGLQASGRHWRALALVFAAAEALLVLQRSADYRSEIAIWTDTVRKVPLNARAPASLASAFVHADRWEDAIPLYQVALRLDPDYADAHSDLATALTHCGRTAEATIHFERAVELKPDDPDLRYNLGNHYAGIGRTAEAARQLATALRLRPDFPKASAALGQVLNQAGRYAEAITVLETAARVLPTDGRVQSELGFARAALHDWPAAETCYRRALELLPPAEATSTRFLLGNLLLETRRAAEAIAVYQEVLQQAPDSSLAHHHLALALALAGRMREAISAEERALEINPHLTEARSNLEQWRLP